MNKSLNDISMEMFSQSAECNRHLDQGALFHYTSASALKKILREEGIVLRFTKYGFVNDKSEGKVILDVYKSACNKLLREQKIGKSFYDEIIGLKKSGEKSFYIATPESGSGAGKMVYDEYDAYICCFSSLPDSLPMWNYYIKDTEGMGYNIEFKNLLLSGLYQSKWGGLDRSNWGIYKIDYVDVSNENRGETFATFCRWIEELAHFEGNMEMVKKLLSGYLLRAELMYKHDCFKHEHEVRYVLYVPKHMKRNQELKIDYMEKKGILVPYIDILIPNKNIVKGLTIGALVSFEDARDGVATLLEERHYPIGEESIRRSGMPVRF